MQADGVHVRAALAASARGYLLKDSAGDAVIGGIRAVAAGQVVLGEEIAGLALRGPEQQPFPFLTPRERQVLHSMVAGAPNEGIAARLGISRKTVQNTVSAVLLKLGVADRASAIRAARSADEGAH